MEDKKSKVEIEQANCSNKNEKERERRFEIIRIKKKRFEEKKENP